MGIEGRMWKFEGGMWALRSDENYDVMMRLDQ